VNLTLCALLAYAVLTMWIPERWAWSLFQIGVFGLAGWRILAGTGAPLRFRPRAWMPLACAAAWPIVQLAIGATAYREATWDAALNWLTFLCIFLLAEGGLRRLACFGPALALVATLQEYSSHGKIFWLFPSGYTEAVFGPFVNRNQYAAWIELLFPAALYLAATDRRRRPLFGAAAAILFASVAASASRAGFVLVCLEALAVSVLSAGRTRKFVLPALKFAGLAVIATAVTGWHTLAARFAVCDAESLRIEAVRASLRMLHEHLWIGTGLGTWPTVYPRYASYDAGVFLNQAHNDWAQWAAEGGLPFFLFLLIFAALLWKPAIRSIYGVGILAFLLHALVDYPMQQRPALAAWFFAVAGMVAASWKARVLEPDDGLLRGAGSEPFGFAGRDPAGLQTVGAAAPSRSLPGRTGTAIGRTADEAVKRNSGRPCGPGETRGVRPRVGG
jgi:hypothetical protein